MRARTGQFAVRARTGQFAGVAALRSALHSYRTFITRGLYFIDRCGFDSVVLQVYPMRNYHFRHAGVLFPATLVTIAAFEAFSRVQSERSKLYSPGQLCTPPVSFADSPLEEGAFCLPLRGRWLPQADGRSVYNKFRSRLKKLPYECRVSGANDYVELRGAGTALPPGELNIIRYWLQKSIRKCFAAPIPI